jgi:hypothetical protein
MVYTSNARMSPVKSSKHTNKYYVTLKENQTTILIKIRKTHKQSLERQMRKKKK